MLTNVNGERAPHLNLAADLRHALSPVAFATEVLGLELDPWQCGVLSSTGKRDLLNCSRQAGKSTTAAVLGRPAPDMRAALKQLTRYLATSNVSKHRIFAWLPSSVLPSHSLTVIARDDDYTLGVLHSSAHEVWASRQGTSLEDRPRYTPSTCFETFPFPHPTDAQKAEIEKWAKYLHTVRSGLLEGDDTLTMTKLYNALTELRETRNSAHPAYALLIAHEKLDAAVTAAYGWEWPLSDEVILERLLGLNLERAVHEKEVSLQAAQ